MNWERSDPSAKLRSQDHISTSSKLSRAQFVLLNSNISIWEFWIMHQHITNPFCLQPAVQSKQYFANVLQIVFWIWSMNLFWLAWWNRRLLQSSGRKAGAQRTVYCPQLPLGGASGWPMKTFCWSEIHVFRPLDVATCYVWYLHLTMPGISCYK